MTFEVGTGALTDGCEGSGFSNYPACAQLYDACVSSVIYAAGLRGSKQSKAIDATQNGATLNRGSTDSLIHRKCEMVRLWNGLIKKLCPVSEAVDLLYIYRNKLLHAVILTL